MFFQEGIFQRLPTLQTPRLILRKVTLRDAQDMFAYSRDPQVSRHVLWSTHEDISQTKDYIRYIISQYHKDNPTSWCMQDKQTGKAIGTIGFMWWNHDNRSAEVGYSMSREFWGKGLMTEALHAVIEFGFMEMHLHRIEAQHEVDNPASGRVMLKNGMRKEGLLRGRLYNKGRFVDVELYAILLEDWKGTGYKGI